MREAIPQDSKLFTLRSKRDTWSFYRPSDPDRILNQITDEEYEKDYYLPFWAEHWPSSEVLFTWCLDTLPEKFQSICELGCGLGVISAALTARGYPVIATDISPYACKYSAANMSKYNDSVKKIVCSDWRDTPFKKQFDCIIASDILYEERWINTVLSFLRNHLLEHGIAFIADPTRNYWETFKQQAVEDGFQTEVVHTQIVNEGKTKVEILRLKKI